MKKLTILSAIVLSIFCLSCTTYTKVAVSLDAAEDKGKVKVKGKLGNDQYYNKIESSDNRFYGVKGKNKTILNEQEVAGVYLSEGKVNKAWITMINPAIKVEGYLYEVTDSSLVVSSTMTLMESQPVITLNNTVVQVSNIQKIKLRRKGSVGKGYLIGTSIGIGVGIIAGIAADDGGWVVFAAAGTLGIIGSLVGTPIGAIAGTKSFKIEGNQDTYNKYRDKLKEASIVKE